MIEMTPQTRIDTLQFFLLVGRLPPDAAQVFIGQTGLPRDMSAAACLMYAGMGVHWPIPCLARKMDGNWFNVIDVCDANGDVRRQ